MRKLILIAAIVALASCTGSGYSPVQEENDSVESVVDTLSADTLTVDTLTVDTL
jgi:hypothetical protein